MPIHMYQHQHWYLYFGVFYRIQNVYARFVSGAFYRFQNVYARFVSGAMSTCLRTAQVFVSARVSNTHKLYHISPTIIKQT